MIPGHVRNAELQVLCSTAPGPWPGHEFAPAASLQTARACEDVHVPELVFITMNMKTIDDPNGQSWFSDLFAQA